MRRGVVDTAAEEGLYERIFQTILGMNTEFVLRYRNGNEGLPLWSFGSDLNLRGGERYFVQDITRLELFLLEKLEKDVEMKWRINGRILVEFEFDLNEPKNVLHISVRTRFTL